MCQVILKVAAKVLTLSITCLLLFFGSRVTVIAQPVFYSLDTPVESMSAGELQTELELAAQAKKNHQYYPEERYEAVKTQLAVRQEFDQATRQAILDLEKVESAYTTMAIAENFAQSVITMGMNTDFGANKGWVLYDEGDKYYKNTKTLVSDSYKLYDAVANAKFGNVLLDVDELPDSTAKAKTYTDAFRNVVQQKTMLQSLQKAQYDEKLFKDGATILKLYDAYNQGQASSELLPEGTADTAKFMTYAGVVIDRLAAEAPGGVNQILSTYAEGMKKAVKIANLASDAVHGQGIQIDKNSPYYDAMNTAKGSEYYDPGYFLSDITKYDKNYQILTDKDNHNYIVAKDSSKKYAPLKNDDGSYKFSDEDIRTFENVVMAHSLSKDKSAPNLTTEQIVDMMNGKTVKVKTVDGLFKDTYARMTMDDVIAMGNSAAFHNFKNSQLQKLDSALNSKGVFGGLFSSFGRDDRLKEYFNFFGSTYNPEMIRALGEGGYPQKQTDQFKLFVDRALELAGKGLGWDDIMAQMKQDAKKKNAQDLGPGPGPWPTPTPGKAASATPKPTPTVTATATATPKASPTPSAKPSKSPSPTPKPTKTPQPSATPTATPTDAPSPTPSGGGGGGGGRGPSGPAGPGGGPDGPDGPNGPNGPNGPANPQGWPDMPGPGKGWGGGLPGGGIGQAGPAGPAGPGGGKGGGGMVRRGPGGGGVFGPGPGPDGGGYGGYGGGFGGVERRQGRDKGRSWKVEKPNIYLYPQETMEVHLLFQKDYAVTASIPAYHPAEGWTVTASPNGMLDHIYGFLFYEANLSNVWYQHEKGWLVQAEEREEAFTRILTGYGLNRQEIADFCAYWTQQLQPDQAYMLYPQTTGVIDKAMPLMVSPNPDAILRLWFVFDPVVPEKITEPEAPEPFVRTGFTMVEWGGLVYEASE